MTEKYNINQMKADATYYLDSVKDISTILTEKWKGITIVDDEGEEYTVDSVLVSTDDITLVCGSGLYHIGMNWVAGVKDD